jgi:hypothetical protein
MDAIRGSAIFNVGSPTLFHSRFHEAVVKTAGPFLL